MSDGSSANSLARSDPGVAIELTYISPPGTLPEPPFSCLELIIDADVSNFPFKDILICLCSYYGLGQKLIVLFNLIYSRGLIMFVILRSF